MIDHSNCDHPRTPSERAKCRRRQNGDTPRAPKASKKSVFFGKAHHDPDRERNRGTTPRDRDKQCMICTIERIHWKGTDPHTGRLIYVGERCVWRIEHMPDFEAVPE